MSARDKSAVKIKAAIRNAHSVGGPAFSLPGGCWPSPNACVPRSAEAKANISKAAKARWSRRARTGN